MNEVVNHVTQRIQQRSETSRGAYMARIHAAAQQGPNRNSLSCSNLAHGIAACGTVEKEALVGAKTPNIGIVSAYNFVHSVVFWGREAKNL